MLLVRVVYLFLTTPGKCASRLEQ